MPTVAGDLGIAIRVISAVNKDVVGNLTKIAESACPTCANITEVIKESVQVIEQTLEKIDPDWQKNPIWKVMSHLTLVVQRNERISPSFARVHICRACTQANLACPTQATFHSQNVPPFASAFCMLVLSSLSLFLTHAHTHARTHTHTHTHTQVVFTLVEALLSIIHDLCPPPTARVSAATAPFDVRTGA